MEQRDDRDKKGTGDGTGDEDLAEIVELLSQWWNRATHDLAVLRSVDVDLLRKELWSAVVDAEVLKLEASGARRDFDRLAEAGCHRVILVAIISLFRYRANIEGFWTLAVGAPEQRSRVCQTLNDAADTLGAYPFAFTPEQGAKISAIGRIPPSKLAEELRLYARVLNLASLIGADLRVRSLDDVSKLVFAAYVERVTGKEFHGPIAGIVADATGSDYTEDALKQVRYRNKSMLADPTSWATRTAAFLGSLTDVLNARR